MSIIKKEKKIVDLERSNASLSSFLLQDIFYEKSIIQMIFNQRVLIVRLFGSYKAKTSKNKSC
jgi:hypothetical protein